MPAPKISVIVPIYKVEQYLIQCLDSIVNQTFRDIEIILIDEGDHDACYAIMKMYAEEDARIKLIHQKCGGYGTACNLALAVATGEYIAIVESDDFLELTMYQELWQSVERTSPDVVKCSFYNYQDRKKGNSVKETDAFTTSLSMLPATAFTIREYPHLMGAHPSLWAGLYRRAFLSEHNIKFSETKPQVYVDVRFRIQTLIEAERIAWVPKHLYNWRLTNPNSTNNNYNLSAMIMRWQEALPLFEDKKDTLDLVAPYFIREFYYTLVCHLFNRVYVTEQRLRDIQMLMSKIDEDAISQSPCLEQRQIAELRQVKRAHAYSEFLGHNATGRKAPWRHYLYAALKTKFILGHDRIVLNFMAGFRRTMLSCCLNFLDKFKAEFVVGNLKKE